MGTENRTYEVEDSIWSRLDALYDMASGAEERETVATLMGIMEDIEAGTASRGDREILLGIAGAGWYSAPIARDMLGIAA